MRGVSLHWNALQEGRCKLVTLPKYAWEHKRYWVKGGPLSMLMREVSQHPLLGHRVPLSSGQVVFDNRLSERAPAFVGEHRIGGRAVVPATAYLELARAAGAIHDGHDNVVLEECAVEQALWLGAGEEVAVQTLLTETEAGQGQLVFSSLSRGEPAQWQVHFRAKVSAGSARAAGIQSCWSFGSG